MIFKILLEKKHFNEKTFFSQKKNIHPEKSSFFGPTKQSRSGNSLRQQRKIPKINGEGEKGRKLEGKGEGGDKKKMGERR